MARTAGEPLLEAHNLHTLGTIEYMRANYTEAEANFQQAQDIFEAVQHRRGQIGCLINFGSLRYQTGSYIEARRQYEKALVLGRRIGWRHTEAFLLASLGNVAFDLGDYGEARRYHKAAMVVRREIGDRPGEAVSLDTLGLLHYIAGENEMAATRCEQALQIQKESADRHSQAYTLFHLGLARHELGRLEAAHEAYAASLHLRRELDEIYVVLDSLGGLARVALAREDVEQATSYAAGILATLAEHDCEGVEMPVLLYLTCYRVLRTAGKTAQAGATLQTGYDLLQERAAALDDPALRQQYLHEVPFHRALLAAHQRESGAPAS
jgi:tetratricopeptide (TPR) repeat protein